MEERPRHAAVAPDRARSDESGDVRQSCGRTSERMEESDPDTLPLLQDRACSDENVYVRQACVEAVARGWKSDLDTLRGSKTELAATKMNTCAGSV